MAIDFSNIHLEVIDITVNPDPEIFINQSNVTFTKRVLEDLNYPQNVQFCIDPTHKIFAIRASKSNEAKSSPFSKSRNEQSSALSLGSKTLHDTLITMIKDFEPKKRYRVVGEFDMEHRIMYYDMSSAEISSFREKKLTTSQTATN